MKEKELKQRAKARLLILDNHLQLLRTTVRVVEKLKVHAVANGLHKRAAYSRTALVGIDFLIEELESGHSLCMEILGAKKVPIVIEKKLTPVTNNEKGGDNDEE